MKAIYNYIIAALVATLALASCTKDIPDTNSVDPQTEGERIIAVSFGNSTKTVLGSDGRTPQFRGGEQILVSNGTAYKKLTVEYDYEKNYCFFSTSLSGTLKAVYPADAAVLKGCEIVGVQVPAEQSGRFEDANIAMAEMHDKGDSQMWFSNKTAVLRFYVDRSIGVTSIEIKGPEGSKIATGSQTILVEAPEPDVPVIGPPAEEEVKPAVTARGMAIRPSLADQVEGRICYVAVLPGNYEKLDFTTNAYTQTLTDGIVKKTYENVKLAANSLANVFIPYYIQMGDIKWAYCNVGAFLPEQTGYYFSWGDNKGHFLNRIPEEYYFIPENYSLGTTLTTDIDPKSEYDTAHKAWGDKWRMPTAGECADLYQYCKVQPIHSEVGLAFDVFANLGEHIVLPAAGYYAKDCTEYRDVSGFYWTSTINNPEVESKSAAGSSEPGAYFMWINMRNDHYEPSVEIIERHFGLPIRPVYDESNEGIIDAYIQGPNV